MQLLPSISGHPGCSAERDLLSLPCRLGGLRGLTFVRHNDLRDITAGLLSRVCSDVATEPHLQPLNDEVITLKSANRQDDARADIHARGFWGRRQSAFLDVRVFYP